MVTVGDVSEEMRAFRNAVLWGDGFMDADPLRPVSWSSYGAAGLVSVYHATYLACIRPYLPKNGIAIEVGPGLGAWTKALLVAGASRVYALDVQAPTADGIYSYLGDLKDKLTYIVVNDCDGGGVPDDIDFFWSFGTFVHLSPAIQAAYAKMIARKLRPGAHGFIQFADFDVWNQVVSTSEYRIHEWMANIIGGDKGQAIRAACADHPLMGVRDTLTEGDRDLLSVEPGRYFFVGTDWICETLRDAGLEIVERNAIPSLRDPVVHFRKAS